MQPHNDSGNKPGQPRRDAGKATTPRDNTPGCREEQEMLDDAVESTFPASDPPAVTQPKSRTGIPAELPEPYGVKPDPLPEEVQAGETPQPVKPDQDAVVPPAAGRASVPGDTAEQGPTASNPSPGVH